MIVHQNCLLFSFKLHTLKSTGKYKHQHIPFSPSTHLYIYIVGRLPIFISSSNQKNKHNTPKPTLNYNNYIYRNHELLDCLIKPHLLKVKGTRRQSPPLVCGSSGGSHRQHRWVQQLCPPLRYLPWTLCNHQRHSLQHRRHGSSGTLHISRSASWKMKLLNLLLIFSQLLVASSFKFL